MCTSETRSHVTQSSSVSPHRALPRRSLTHLSSVVRRDGNRSCRTLLRPFLLRLLKSGLGGCVLPPAAQVITALAPVRLRLCPLKQGQRNRTLQDTWGENRTTFDPSVPSNSCSGLNHMTTARYCVWGVIEGKCLRSMYSLLFLSEFHCSTVIPAASSKGSLNLFRTDARFHADALPCCRRCCLCPVSCCCSGLLCLAAVKQSRG